METNRSPNGISPSPEEAAAALRQVRQARSAGGPPIAWWIFVTVAAIQTAGFLVALLSALEMPVFALAAAVAVGAFWLGADRVYRRQAERAGIEPRYLSPGQQAVIWGLPGPLLIAALVYDRPWFIAVGAGVSAVITLGFALYYRRRIRTTA